MDIRAMEPFGEALREFYRGEDTAECQVYRDDGYVGQLSAASFFRDLTEFSPIEQRAIDLCKGRILDIGAGAGCHSLALQQRGMDVLAIDVCPAAIDIMGERGVKHAQRTDVFELQDGKFDTLLMMMHGIGLVQNLAGLDRFLDHAHRLITPGGQILGDSLDVRCTDESEHLAYQEANRQSRRYFGEVRMRFEYKGQIGPLFGWLHVDPETLAEHARQHRWLFQAECQTAEGDYLARLVTMA
ncbi:MAG TPA: class I SAM-dependent methyltransferase [Anaerolineales bacterium]|nr:class I SAM-dependent methyltransferase [Anaerolineales bacterium]